MDTPWWLFLVAIEFPAVMGFLDCLNRPADHFPGGAEDRTAWLRWLGVCLLTVPILVGYGILLGYYYVIVRRNAPGTPR